MRASSRIDMMCIMKKEYILAFSLFLAAAIAVGAVVYAVGRNKNEDEPVSAPQLIIVTTCYMVSQ